ncbi:MAG: RluA family pseudouridine synthase [Burkholderiaceae bacterium]
MNTPTNPVFTEQDAQAVTADVASVFDDADDADEFAVGVDDLAPISLTLDSSSCGIRLDKVLATHLPQYSRARLQQWIDSGHVLVDGNLAKAKSGMLGDELITVQPQPANSDFAYQPEPIALDVIHEDDAIIVINKPVGMVVHPAAGNWQGTLLNGLLHRWPQLAGVPRAGIVHRLDKDTSGLLVVAKTLSAQTDLVRQLQERSMGRAYLALVWGQPISSGRVEAAIARHSRDRTRMAVSKSPLAKPAITHYTRVANGVLEGKPVALLRCQLETGRTHQIRVHLQSIGFPLVGDTVYGKQHLAAVFPRQALHAVNLQLRHPASQQSAEWFAPLPGDLQQLLARAGIDQKVV